VSQTESDEQDLTRKQRREQARTERKAAEEAVAAGAARRRRMTQLGGAVAVVVVAIVVILVATGSSGKSKAITNEHVGGAIPTKVESELAGIPQSANVLGNPTAPVTLQYFGDLECPFCREFTVSALPTLIQKWVRAGKLRIEYHSLETATREPETFRTQQVAALASGKQNKMWNYVELFYNEQGEENSGYVTESFLQGLARQITGLSLSKWTSDRSEHALQAQVEADSQAANAAGLTGTPAFLVGKTGGAMKKLDYTSVTDPTAFNEAIEKLLKG
jgi:protein-disulfide isomerase